MSESQIANAIKGLSKSQGGLNVPDIKEVLRRHGLSVVGTRDTLVQRLRTIPSAPKAHSAPEAHSTPEPADISKVPKVTDLDYDPARKIVYLTSKFLKGMSGLLISSDSEIGGAIDLRIDGSFDRNIYGIGGKNSIITTDFDDFEITYHTHPINRERYFNIPSPDDIANAVYNQRKLKDPTQVEIVFTLDAVYVIYIHLKKRITSDRLVELYRIHGITSTASLRDPRILRLFDDLAQYGIYVLRYGNSEEKPISLENPIVNWPTEIPLYLNPQEPAQLILPRIKTRDADHLPSLQTSARK